MNCSVFLLVRSDLFFVSLHLQLENHKLIHDSVCLLIQKAVFPSHYTQPPTPRQNACEGDCGYIKRGWAV